MLSLPLARTASAVVMFLVVAAVALGAPLATADAASPRTAAAASTVLTEGVGMGNRPSVRVRRVQRILARRGYDLGAPGVDGRFGPLTAAAVRRFQARSGLIADGVVGGRTRRALDPSAAGASGSRGRRPTREPQSSTKTQPPPASTTTEPASPAPPAASSQSTPSEQQSRPEAQGSTPLPSSLPPAETTSTPKATPTQLPPVTVTPESPPVTVPQATGTTQQAPAPATTPAAQRTLAKDTRASLPTILAAIAALLAAVGMIIAFARWRPRRPSEPVVVSIDRDLYLEGHSDRADVGSFRGFALATAVAPDAPDDASRIRYLIDDPQKPAPVWVHGGDVRRSPSQLGAGEPVIGYVTADPDPAQDQEAFMRIEAVCEQAGWKLLEIARDQDAGRMVGRPGLTHALEQIAAGKARGLIVSDARQLVRSVTELGELLEWFRDAEAAFIALDLDLDTATIPGWQTAATLISVAGWESQRTQTRARRGLARVRPSTWPVPHGPQDRVALVERITAMREAGMSLQAIADQLRNEGVPPLRAGAKWMPATVQAALANPPRSARVRDGLPPIPDAERRR